MQADNVGPPETYVLLGAAVSRAGQSDGWVIACSTRASSAPCPRAAIAARIAAGRHRMLRGGCIQDGGAQPVAVRMTELERRQLLGMRVEQPWVIDEREQDQRLARRQRAAHAAHERARRKARARHARHLARRRRERPPALPAILVCGPAFPARAGFRSPVAARARTARARARPGPGDNICAPRDRRSGSSPRRCADRDRRAAPACRSRPPRSRAATACRRAAAPRRSLR